MVLLEQVTVLLERGPVQKGDQFSRRVSEGKMDGAEATARSSAVPDQLTEDFR